MAGVASGAVGKGGALQQHDGNGGDGSPEQRPPGHQKGIVPAAHPPQQDGIDGPAGGGSQRQQITPGVQLQDKSTVEYHQDYSGKGNEKSQQCPAGEALLTGEVGQDGGEDGSCRHDDADVCGQRVGEGSVFRVEVERTAGKAHQQKGPLLPRGELHSSGPQQPQCGIGQ